MKILLVDRDINILHMLQGLLTSQPGYRVKTACNVAKMRREWLGRPDIVIMDPALEDDDAMAICKQLWSLHDPCMLAMSKDAAQEVILLEGGADAFLQKPFLPGYLLAYIQALSRRTMIARREIDTPGISVDLLHNTAIYNGERIKLTPQESRILWLFVHYPRRVLTADEIIAYAWGAEGATNDLLKSHIYKIRKKLDWLEERLYTHWGVGYEYVPSEGAILS